jgi:hypothetical protein
MRTISKIFCLSAAMAIALIIGGASAQADDAASQNPEDMMKAVAEIGKPGPEHTKLEPLIGNWTYSGKFWMDPSQQPMDCSGTIERKWTLGGRFVEEKWQGTGVDGKSDFEGIGLVGYDNGRKIFTSTFACNMGTAVCTGTGSCDASGKVFTFESESFCPIQKKLVKGRDVLRIESKDKTVMESFMMNGDKEIKIMEIVAVRKK